ncbi:hypothetical protein [Plantactinospora sonchi]|uniref:Uncharacterized protein n=1 Tax=Plantactinospora sonchi TaxID=1544735 RepID=A0ABU7RNR5_9ACTN
MSVDPTGAGTPSGPPSDPWQTGPSEWSTPPAYEPSPYDPPAHQPPLPPTPGAPGPAYPPTQAYPGGIPPVSGPPTSVVPAGAGQWQSPGHEPVVAQIGELTVTPTTVRTPSGDIPLAGSQWHVADYWQTEQKIPTWAVVCAIVGFCFLTVFSLLFLLAKETVHRGVVQVTVTNGARQYVARVPVVSQPQVQAIHQQVNYVRSLAAS